MKTRSKIALSALGGVIIALAGFRLYLPTLVRDYVNRELNNIPGYRGHVDDIGIKLWRGAYQIRGAKLEKVSGKVPVPFFSGHLIDLSIQWDALLHRRIVGRIALYRPEINIVNGPTSATSQTQVNKRSSMQTIKKLMPFKINRLEVHDGEIHFRDYSRKPKVDIAITRLEAFATNLSNVHSQNTRLPGHIHATALCFDSGQLQLNMDIDPFNKEPTFELKQSVTGVELTKLNDFLDAYAKIKARSGKISVFTNIAAKDGAYAGYLKPLIKNLKIDKQSGSDKPLKIAWAWGATVIGKIFSNPLHKQIATEVPITGRFKKTDVDVFAALGGLLENAYIRALAPSFDKTVHLRNVESAGAEARHI